MKDEEEDAGTRGHGDVSCKAVLSRVSVSPSLRVGPSSFILLWSPVGDSGVRLSACRYFTARTCSVSTTSSRIRLSAAPA